MLRCKAVQDIIHCIYVYPVHIILCCISSFVAYHPCCRANRAFSQVIGQAEAE